MTKINRKSASEKPSSPDQLEPVTVKKPPIFWLSILGAAVILVAVLVLFIFWRQPIPAEDNGILVSGDDVYSIYSEAQGVLAEIFVAEGDTITKGQVLAAIEGSEDSDARAAMKELEDRIATVEAVTLTSQDDVTNADTQSILEIKNSISTSDAPSLQSQETLSLYEKRLNRERRYLDKLAEELDRAEREYDNAIQAKAGSLAAYTNAERAYQAAEAALETAKQPLQSADTPWSEAKAYVRPYEEAVDSAKAAVEESERAIDQKNRRDAAMAAVRSAEKEVDTAQAAVNAAQSAVNSADLNSEGYADLLEALEKAQSNLEQAKNTWTAASNNPDLLLTPSDTAIAEYQARAAALAGREAELSSAKAACGYDTYKAAYIAAENAYNQANTAFKAAEKAYQEASDAYQSNDADASQKTAVCLDARTKHYNQQVYVATLEKKVLSARGQADSDSTQTAALANQFETTKASILSQLRAELEQTEKTLNITYITSSRDGVVAELPVSIGTMVEPGTEIVKLRG